MATFNDPIHGRIQVSIEELAIIDHPLFQRLRRVKQLTTAYLVYPSATHTRFEHCIGVMHICGLHAAHLYPGQSKLIQIARISGLLHDIAHGPFSHSWDRAVYNHIYPGVEKGHDLQRIIFLESTLKPLIENCGITTYDIRNVWDGTDGILHAVLSGPVGADRLDFIHRDSYFVGLSHLGSVPISRIIECSAIAQRDGKDYLHYQSKVVDDIYHVLLKRFTLYKQVYFHKAVAAGGILTENMILSASKHLEFVDKTNDPEDFINLTDASVETMIQLSSDPKLRNARNHLQRLHQRKLPKLVWERSVSMHELQSYAGTDVNIKIAAEKYVYDSVLSLIDDDVDYYIVSHIPIATLQPQHFDKAGIYVLDEVGTSMTFREQMYFTHYFASFCRDDADETVLIRVFVDEEHRPRIQELLAQLGNTRTLRMHRSKVPEIYVEAYIFARSNCFVKPKLLLGRRGDYWYGIEIKIEIGDCIKTEIKRVFGEYELQDLKQITCICKPNKVVIVMTGEASGNENAFPSNLSYDEYEWLSVVNLPSNIGSSFLQTQLNLKEYSMEHMSNEFWINLLFNKNVDMPVMIQD